jgi:hypothetical protein
MIASAGESPFFSQEANIKKFQNRGSGIFVNAKRRALLRK